MDSLKNNNEYSFLTDYLRNKFWIIGLVILCVVVAFFYLESVIPKYRITANAEINHVGTVSAVDINKVIYYLKSDAILEKTLNELLSRTLSDQYRQNLVIATQNSNNRELIFSLLDKSPQTARIIINRLIDNYNNSPISIIGAGQTSKAFDSDSFNLLNNQLSALDEQSVLLKKHRINKKHSELPVARKKISENDEVQLKLYEVFVPYLKSSVTQFSIIPYADEIRDQDIRKLVERFNEGQNNKQLKLRDLKENDPSIRSNNSTLSLLQKDILAKISVKKAELINGTKPILAQAMVNDKKVRDSIRLIDQLIRQKLEQRDRYARKLNQPIIIDDKARLVIIRQPQWGSDPEYPKKGFTYIFAFIIGLALPAFIPYLSQHVKSFASNKVTELQDLKKITTIPSYGTLKLGSSANHEAPMPFDILSSISKHLKAGEAKPILLITSIAPIKEKSLFIKFLANKLVAGGKRIVLVDFNFREPVLQKSFDLEDQAGVITYLEEWDTNLDDLLISLRDDKSLYIIGSGAFYKENADPVTSFFKSNDLASPWADENKLDGLIRSPRIQLLFRELRAKFDYILIDAPSVNHPADLFPLVAFSNMEMIALINYSTNKPQIKNLENLVERKRFNNPVIFYLG